MSESEVYPKVNVEKLMNQEKLDALAKLKKQQCSGCGRKRMYYCYDCRIYMPGVELIVPSIDVSSVGKI